MIKKSDQKMSIRHKCMSLGLSRSSYYAMALKNESPKNIRLMNEIDILHTKYPFYGSRRITEALRARGEQVNRKRIQRLMNLMNITCIYPGPKTTIVDDQHRKFPYLLRGMTIDHSNKVWSTDITYIPMAKGFMYLCAVIDWYSRKVIHWELSNTMTKGFCIKVLKAALATGHRPEIFNTDQGSQFTSNEFIDVLKDQNIKISMDGRGRALDNVYIERLWWSVKYENVYLNAYETGNELRRGLKEYFDFYNNQRLHQALKYQTPAQVYCKWRQRIPIDSIQLPSYAF
jgi:putative transposase